MKPKKMRILNKLNSNIDLFLELVHLGKINTLFNPNEKIIIIRKMSLLVNNKKINLMKKIQLMEVSVQVIVSI
jgi:hypothetical protein